LPQLLELQPLLVLVLLPLLDWVQFQPLLLLLLVLALLLVALQQFKVVM
jgi:hypothetical protein